MNLILLSLPQTHPSSEPPRGRPGSAVSRLVTTAIYQNRHANVVLEEDEVEDKGRSGMRLTEQV
jgi:hypothetical protein